ncbi:hypothetical protein A6X21_18005 [Planctopirus hydrillae]|uniref:Uncharacterized protein n=1 Tax=Planctopirus hydrillae TaxID=1841610 RepID=A0A1C3EL33_9PLAN|nr:hypothetical protein A6X21_18005 [Planctopirus hydrillae]
MVSREQAIEAAWQLFITVAPVSEVREVEARLIDGTWAVVFFKHIHSDFVESPGVWIVEVLASGQPQWFEVM